jgi:hypothetical protein
MKKLLLFLFITQFIACSTTKEIKKIENFLISDGTTFNKKSFYPNFSWDVTPQYLMFADGQRVLNANEVARIAKLGDFICIEKNHAKAALGYAELGTKHEVAAFKKVKPSLKVLYYFNSAYAWPFTSYNENFTRAKIEEHPELKKFLIKNIETGELEHRNNIFHFDVLNPDFRKWWVETVAKGVKDSNADGVFIDQMHAFVWLRREQRKEVKKAMGEMMEDLKTTLGTSKIVLANNAEKTEDVFPHVDAIMFEHFNSSKLTKKNLLEEWDDMLRIAKAGKMSVFRIGVEAEEVTEEEIKGLPWPKRSSLLEEKSKERETYFLAAYLIGAQPYSYFQYGWGWRLDTGPMVNYPELIKPLGAPKAAYKRTSMDKWEFTREFKHANVWINTDKKIAEITWLK